jgi:hypothetical protein
MKTNQFSASTPPVSASASSSRGWRSTARAWRARPVSAPNARVIANAQSTRQVSISSAGTALTHFQ